MSQNQNIPTPEATKPSGLSSDAMARRRMLVKSLGKGSSVIAAAAIPMHTLAATGTLAVTESGTGTAGKRCTISGTMSGVHSQETVKDVCIGFHPSYYSTLANWPNYVSTGGGSATNSTGTISFTEKSKFVDVFGGSSTQGNKQLILIMGSISDEAHWIAALLNSVNTKANNFPYSATQVIAFYNSTTQYSNALSFFKNYMETHLS